MFETYKNYSNTFVLDTGVVGPTVTIFGGIHGDEIAGVRVVDHLKKDIENKKLTITHGKLILAYGNEKAIEIGEREYQYNLNRLFKDEFLNSNEDVYEIKRVKQLSEILDEADYLLDLHSVSSPSEAFIFAEDIADELDIANIIFNGKKIIGWDKIAGDIISGDTNGYMHKNGKVGLTLECGNHKDEQSFEVGLEVSLAFLACIGICTERKQNNISTGECYEMYKIEVNETGEIKFNKKFKNFEAIQNGDSLYSNGKKQIYAEQDFIMLLPNYDPKIKLGEEIFYYGKQK